MFKMRNVIILNGKGDNGKGTFVKFCKKYNYLTYNISTVDLMKEALSVMYVDVEKRKTCDKTRKLISDLKNMMSKFNDCSKKYVQTQIERLNKTLSSYILFVDSREPEEIQWFVNNLGAKTMLIRGKNDNKIYGNSSDDNVENYNYDYYIENKGTLEELEEKARRFVENLDEIE